MYCHQCGIQNPDFATRCANCGAPFGNPYQASAALPAAGQPQLNNYLMPAIFATMCCCLPFGIVSIVYAAQVNAKLGEATCSAPHSRHKTRRCGFGSR